MPYNRFERVAVSKPEISQRASRPMKILSLFAALVILLDLVRSTTPLRPKTAGKPLRNHDIVAKSTRPRATASENINRNWDDLEREVVVLHSGL